MYRAAVLAIFALLASVAFPVARFSVLNAAAQKRTSSAKKSSQAKTSPKKRSSAKAKPKTAARKSAAKKKTTSRRRVASRKTPRRRTSRPAGQTKPSPERYQEIQQALIDKGFFQGPADGDWNAGSVQALKSFQQAQKLQPTGKIDALSLISLGLGPKRDPGGAGVRPAAPPPEETGSKVVSQTETQQP